MDVDNDTINNMENIGLHRQKYINFGGKCFYFGLQTGVKNPHISTNALHNIFHSLNDEDGGKKFNVL